MPKAPFAQLPFAFFKVKHKHPSQTVPIHTKFLSASVDIWSFKVVDAVELRRDHDRLPNPEAALRHLVRCRPILHHVQSTLWLLRLRSVMK